MTNNVLVVFTAKGGARLESEGGTANWSLSTRWMRDVEYVICTRNTDPTKVAEFGNQSSVPHGAAFLVGKVTGLAETEAYNGRQRYRVLFDEVADVNVPDFWDGSRVPTRYISSAEAKAKGVDLTALTYRPVVSDHQSAEADEKPAGRQSELGGLSIPEAKAGLALRFGISTADIDILIRG